jgi:hypothetical protein
VKRGTRLYCSLITVFPVSGSLSSFRLKIPTFPDLPTSDGDSEISIERLIADLDFKLLGAIEKVNHNSSRFWDKIMKNVNKVAEVKELNMRYTSLFELQKISIDSRKSLDEIRDQALKEKKK